MLNDERYDERLMTPGLETLALEARSAQKTAESPEAALSAEARRCVQAVLATIRLLPAGAMVAWPCFGLSVSRPSSDDAGNAILMTLRVRRSGAVLRLRDTPRGLEVYETRSWGSLPVLHHRASEIARRIEGAVDLAAFARVV